MSDILVEGEASRPYGVCLVVLLNIDRVSKGLSGA